MSVASGSGIDGRSIKGNTLQPGHLTDRFRKHGYFYEKFGAISSILQFGTAATPVTVPTLPTAAQGNVSRILTPHGNTIEMFSTTAQTLLPLPHATKGWDIACDAVENETIELVPGGNFANSPYAMLTSGTGAAPNFYQSVTLEITDADGSDQMLMGFRKAETYAVPTSLLTTGDGIYTDFCGIGFAKAVADPNPVSVASDVANGGSTTVSQVSFTWADTLKHKLEMWVVGRVARFFINGVQLGGRVAFDAAGAAITAQTTKVPHTYTFGTALSVVPTLILRHDAAVSEAIYISEWEVGTLEMVGKDPAQRGA